MDQRVFLDTKQAAVFLGMSWRTLNKKRSVGGGPVYFRTGKNILYLEGDLLAWMNDRRFTSTSDYSVRQRRDSAQPAPGDV
jgi:hypothetical protein